MRRMTVAKLSVLVLGILWCAPGERAEADGWFRRRSHWPHSYGPVIAVLPVGAVPVLVNGDSYYSCRGAYYKYGPRGYVIVPAPVGAVVTTLPEPHRTILIDGIIYHEYGGVYYKGGPAGYTVVPMYQVESGAASVAVSSLPSTSATTGQHVVVVNVPNKNGSYSPVTLQLAGNGMYIGPQGEVYPNLPAVGQLQAMYGK